MSVRLYTDVHVPFAITAELRIHGVDVLTAQTDNAARLEDLLKVATQRQRAGVAFAGVIYAHQLRISIGQCVEDLELIAKATDLEEWGNRVEFLPL